MVNVQCVLVIGKARNDTKTQEKNIQRKLNYNLKHT